MIRKVLNTLFKPNLAFRSAQNKYAFAQSPKDNAQTVET